MSLQRLRMVAAEIKQMGDDLSVLDLGCRTRELEPLLSGDREYFGTDFAAAEGVHAVDLEEPLPFEDNAYDIVCALDVLEHLEHCHAALAEAIRVARKAVFVSLPNMHYISFRLNFLKGAGLSGKYTFHPHRVLDRHRWVLSRTEAINFIDANAQSYPVEHTDIIPERGRTRLVVSPIERVLARRFPDVFVYGTISKISVG